MSILNLRPIVEIESVFCYNPFLMPEVLALPEPYGIGNIKINSSNLLDYLMIWDPRIFRGRIDFASDFDLAIVEPYLRELQAEEKLGYIHSQEDREWAVSHDLSTIKNPIIREIERSRRESWQRVLDKQIPVERNRSMYFNEEDEMIYITPPTHGDTFGTTVDTFDLLKAGHDPLFEIHTHPVNRLFSPQDYQRILLGTSPGRQRALKGAILLCPDLQVLALVTPETLLLSASQLDEFMKRYDLEKSGYGLQIREINDKIGDILNRPFIRTAELITESGKSIYEEEKCFNKGLYSKEEFDNCVRQTKSHYKRRLNRFDNYYNKTAPERLLALSAKRNLLYNEYDLTIARATRAKFYIATDFRHFQEFAA